MTIEDPVEYRMAGVNHLQAESIGGLDFAAGLRAILRQDADIVMVGEIRDPDTAQTAMRAALTGILVFSSIHAADCSQLPDVLAQYGVDRRVMASALMGAVAQRLVRRVCPDCRQPFEPDARMLSVLGITRKQLPDGVLYRGIGCPRCLHTGYRGRTGIFEVLEFGEPLRQMVFNGIDRSTIREVAVRDGMQPLRVSGLHKVLDGTTTVEELIRATGMAGGE
jgi:type II secretory ATPase GspE/PulE/Tfp pilus assembly ATPase PilB-like protein